MPTRRLLPVVLALVVGVAVGWVLRRPPPDKSAADPIRIEMTRLNPSEGPVTLTTMDTIFAHDPDQPHRRYVGDRRYDQDDARPRWRVHVIYRTGSVVLYTVAP